MLPWKLQIILLEFGTVPWVKVTKIYYLPGQTPTHTNHFKYIIMTDSWSVIEVFAQNKWIRDILQVSNECLINWTNLEPKHKMMNDKYFFWAKLRHCRHCINPCSPPGLVQAPSRFTTLRWWPIWIRIFSSDMSALHSLFVAPPVTDAHSGIPEY